MASTATLFVVVLFGIDGCHACSQGTACHYGKHWEDLTAWLTEQDFTGKTCHDVYCTDRRVQVLLSHEPTGCDDTVQAKWQELKESCHQVGGVCCGECELAHLHSCDVSITNDDQFEGAIYAAFAALLSVAVLQWDGNQRPLPSVSYAARPQRTQKQTITNWEF